MNSALDVAKYVITYCSQRDNPISNLHLQKTLYYVQKYFLMQGKIAFEDDFEAWQFGPVIPSVYYYFCGYGGMEIDQEFDVQLDKSTNLRSIDSIVYAKMTLNPWELVADTHKKGSAWDEIYNNGHGFQLIIPQDLIRKKG